MLFLSLLFIGPGKYSMDDQISSIRKARHTNAAKSEVVTSLKLGI